jgi:hypothetical protein
MQEDSAVGSEKRKVMVAGGTGRFDDMFISEFESK